MKKTLCFLFLTALFLACQTEVKKEELKLRNGYTYEMYTQKEGAKPKVGQVVSIDFDILDDFNNVLSDSRDAEIRPTIMIPSTMDKQTKKNPLLSLIEVMSEGDSAVVYVPIDSLSTPPAEFLQSKTIRYRVVVRHVETEKQYMSRVGEEEQRIKQESLAEAREALELYNSGKLDDKIVEKNGEVKMAIVKPTEGVKADYDELAFVHYYGFFKDGEIFDDSYKLGKPYGFRVGKGQVIRGWDITISDIPEGATAILDIPYQMAYGPEGKQGSIPPKSDLIFWVKIDRVEKSKKVIN